MKTETSPYYQLAYDFALSTNKSIFLTGKAGTGKTTFLHKLKNETKKQMAIVAPTGVAAINAGGTTMHSFFQLPFSPFVPTAEERKALLDRIKMQANKRKVIQELELLVIDEISMVRADILDEVDTILRQVRYRHHEPFGGVQMIFIGDMFQLSPVATNDEWRLLSQYYSSPYFFHSQVLQQQQPVYIELDKIFRQSNQQFINVLNEVRNNCLSQQSLDVLQSRFNPTFIPPKDDTYITLTTHNHKADRINSVELDSLSGKTYKLKAEVSGEFPEKSFPTDEELTLKIGAKVMFIKNDIINPRRFYNGKIGVVKSITNDIVSIECADSAELIELEKMEWENKRYSMNSKTKQIEEEIIGKFVQFPLRLAWAITIHKSQGLTFDKAVIDAGNAFTSGQVYVALSRCRSLDGLVLLSRINPESIENDRLVVEHERNKLPAEILEKQLRISQNEFRIYTLNEIFDFRTSIGHLSRLQRTVNEAKSSFNAETTPFLNEILKQLQQIQEVADKFQMQLKTIFANEEVNELFLEERLNAAKGFFVEKIQKLSDCINESPANTDSRENAREYNDGLKNIFSFVEQKKYILSGLLHPFTVENYFQRKNGFYLPDFKVNAYTKDGAKKSKQSQNPQLFYQLIALRNEICEPHDLPIYLVAGSQTLVEMADYLPLNDTDLLKISGFGKAKVEKYGSLFLNVIRKYCAENKLESQMAAFVPAKTKKSTSEKKEKKADKEKTHEVSYKLYQEGKSVEEIATERGFAVNTIIGHLSKFIVDGTLDINEFVSEEKRAKALSIINNTSIEGSVYQMLSGELNAIETSFFFAWKRSQKS